VLLGPVRDGTVRLVNRTAIQERLDALGWYHTVDVVDGATTKGWFDLRHALPDLPFPDVRGKRCLDIGTWDGFYAFELERRGAAEVVALDVPDLAGIDYPPEVRVRTDFDFSQTSSQPRSAGFKLLHEILDSKVEWRGGSIYDLDPEVHGTFDVVVCGSLLVHLRDPVRALDAVRSVTTGHLLSIDHLHPPVQLLSRKRPLFQLRGMGSDFQWWLPNDAGARHLLRVGGFQVERTSPYFLLRHGVGNTPEPGRSIGHRITALGNRVLARDSSASGHLHRAYLTSPRL
jgi:tRNA (mo5U34)-methyltransferase